jgi:leukotriene-A4 hydrolase
MRFVSTLALLLFTQISFAADPHSYAEPERIQIKHIDLDLQIDLEKQTLGGTATLTLNRIDESANLILDSNQLKIQQVKIKSSKGKWNDLKFTTGASDPILGEKIEIELPKTKDRIVQITYAAAPTARALLWNTPAQTISFRPFLLTNNEPINARSWIPTQDTPIVRSTFNAKIQVAQTELMAVMSANNNPTKLNTKGIYEFSMDIPVPSYLISLAVGKLEFKSTGPRTGVYAEPGIIEKAASEFSDAEKMLQAAERLYGKYVWGRYDLLVLPASYPWGGMENPKLTFITPTIITGKKDLVDVVAHEIAHSWSGNLVTNAKWNDLWINEGFTTYVQYRIIEELHGEQIRMRDMALDKSALEESINDKETNAEDTRLRFDYTKRDPEDAFSDVPYIKGAYMLYAIEEKVGKAKFDQFLRDYFAKFTFKSVSTDQAVEELSKIVDQAFLKAWIDSPGIPSDAPKINSKIISQIDEKLKTYKMVGGAPDKKYIEQMTSKDICYYLQSLPRKPKAFKLQHLDASFGFSSTSDPEVRTLWYKLALPRNYKPAMETVSEFLSSVGRGKFVVPIFDALIETKEGRKLAAEIYEKNKTFYSQMVRGRIEKKLNLKNNK